MHVAIVTAYPPNKGSLNEYAYHFINEMRQKPEITKLTILADELPEGETYPIFEDDLVRTEVITCWRFGSWKNALSIRNTVAKIQPDLVLFNIQFASFAGTRAAAALGLTAPLLVKTTTKAKTAILLHNIMETVDLESAGFGQNRLLSAATRAFGTIITRMLLASDMVALTIPKYIEILQEKYHADNLILMPHGSFEQVDDLDLQASTSDTKRIMTFGKFGTYKRVENLIQAFEQIQDASDEQLELVIAGTDNPNVKGYLESMQQQYAHVPNMTFTGYVAEEDVPELFKSSDVVVFPYTSTTGSSGVLHQAGSYGRAVVLPNLGDFAELITDEGYVGEFFEPDSVNSLASAIQTLLDDNNLRIEQGQQNYLAAKGVALSDVVDWYILHFEYLLRANTKTQLIVPELLRYVQQCVSFFCSFVLHIYRKNSYESLR